MGIGGWRQSSQSKLSETTPRFILKAAFRLRAPCALAGNGFRINVQKVFCFVEDKPFLWIIRPINAERIF